MKIDFNAFQDCISLKELYFKQLDEPISIGILDSNNLPNDFAIIVPDSMYEQQKQIFSRFQQRYVKSHSMYKLDSLKTETQNFNVYLALCHLKKLIANNDFSNAIIDLIDYLKTKFQIDDNKLQKISDLYDV